MAAIYITLMESKQIPREEVLLEIVYVHTNTHITCFRCKTAHWPGIICYIRGDICSLVLALVVLMIQPMPIVG